MGEREKRKKEIKKERKWTKLSVALQRYFLTESKVSMYIARKHQGTKSTDGLDIEIIMIIIITIINLDSVSLQTAL